MYAKLMSMKGIKYRTLYIPDVRKADEYEGNEVLYKAEQVHIPHEDGDVNVERQTLLQIRSYVLQICKQ